MLGCGCGLSSSHVSILHQLPGRQRCWCRTDGEWELPQDLIVPFLLNILLHSLVQPRLSTAIHPLHLHPSPFLSLSFSLQSPDPSFPCHGSHECWICLLYVPPGRSGQQVEVGEETRDGVGRLRSNCQPVFDAWDVDSQMFVTLLVHQWIVRAEVLDDFLADVSLAVSDSDAIEG